MQRDLDSLINQTFDLLVIGAGVHGACVARDAALRGLKVALIDKGDICGATSHNSLKTIHGGIRYLQHLNFKRTLESIREQKSWLETAPHLVKPLSFMMPTYGHGMRGPFVMYFGIKLFEFLSYGRNKRLSTESKLTAGRILSKKETLAAAPDIPSENLTGGALWDEAQVEFADQAVMQIVQHAAELGAVVCNYVAASKFLWQKKPGGKSNSIIGAQAIDDLTHNSFEIRAKIVVNAAGPWAGELLKTANPTLLNQASLALSKSMNIVTRLPANKLAIGVQSDLQSDSKLGDTKRLFFMVPWQGYTVIGTTHFQFNENPNVLSQKEQEIDDFIDEINHAYPSLNLSISDVLYCYQGLGPADDKATSKATQLHDSKVIDHACTDQVDGLISIISIKWTTARLVAENTVNLATKKLNPNSLTATKHCQTRFEPIPSQPQLSAEFHCLDDEDLTLLCERHIEQTMAIRLSDMLLRRTNDVVTSRLSPRQIKLIARLMSAHFSWTADDQKQELKLLSQNWLSADISKTLKSGTLWSDET